MDDNRKNGDRTTGEEVAVDELAKAVKTLAENKQRAFGPSERELAARKAELQRQKVALHREGQL